MLDMGARTANQFNRWATAQKWQSGISGTRNHFLGNKLRQNESLMGLLETELWKHRGNVGPTYPKRRLI